MGITEGEKLILSMLCDIHRHLGIKGEVDAGFVQSALAGGHDWALRRAFPALLAEFGDADEAVSEVQETLTMWSCIEEGRDRMSDADRSRVAEAALLPGGLVRFPGFERDGPDGLAGIARVMIDQLGLFGRFRGRYIKQQTGRAEPDRRRMLALFGPMYQHEAHGALNADQIIRLLGDCWAGVGRGDRTD